MFAKNYFSISENGAFLKKLMLFSFFYVPALIVGLSWFVSNYDIRIDYQSAPCLNKHLFIVDKHDLDVQRGGIYSFKAEGISSYIEEGHYLIHSLIPYYEDGKLLMKVVDALPGDRVSISDEGVFVNGENMGIGGLPLFKTLKKEKAFFTREFIVPEGHVFVSGRTDASFDSRYFGTIKISQINGRGYPII